MNYCLLVTRKLIIVAFTQISPINRAFSSSHIITYKSHTDFTATYFLWRTEWSVSPANQQEDIGIINKFSQSDSSRYEFFRLKWNGSITSIEQLLHCLRTIDCKSVGVSTQQKRYKSFSYNSPDLHLS